MVVDEPNVPNQADSTYAQTLFREIATEIFPYLGMYPTEEITDELLLYLGLSRDDVVKGGTNRETFQAFDIYGNLYQDAYVNDEGVVVHGEEEIPVEGASINENGDAVDAWGNVKELVNKVTVLDPKADNPNIAAPPEKTEDGSGQGSGTTWDGVTNEDLEDE